MTNIRLEVLSRLLESCSLARPAVSEGERLISASSGGLGVNTGALTRRQSSRPGCGWSGIGCFGPRRCCRHGPRSSEHRRRSLVLPPAAPVWAPRPQVSPAIPATACLALAVLGRAFRCFRSGSGRIRRPGPAAARDVGQGLLVEARDARRGFFTGLFTGLGHVVGEILGAALNALFFRERCEGRRGVLDVSRHLSAMTEDITLAVPVGFEPTVDFHPHNFSRVAPSAARTRYREIWYARVRRRAN